MTQQLALFFAEPDEPRPEDLGGVLAAHGQAARSPVGTRLSILLDARWRADALLAECRARDISAEAVALSDRSAGRAEPSGEQPVAGGARSVLLRTDRLPQLAGLADAWSRGAVKSVPPNLALGAGLLRCWALAAGRRVDGGFLLGLDPHARHTHEPLAAACSRAGVAGSIVGVRSGHPAIRVVGHRRMMRLADVLGAPPPGAPATAFPAPRR